MAGRVPPANFPQNLRHTRDTEIFDEIWENSQHPRHRQYHEAIHPKLWACRCFPFDEYNRQNVVDLLCPCFRKRYELYAYLGGGAAGTVWAARRRIENPDGSDQYNHVAVKIMHWRDTDSNNPSATVRLDSSTPDRNHIKLLRYLKLETLMQNLVGDMAVNIPEIIEVFSHNPYVIMVTNLLAYWHVNGLDDVPPFQGNPTAYIGEDDDDKLDYLPHLNQCSGEVFENDHTPDDVRRVSHEPGSRSLGETVEAQMCMVFHGLLQAFHHIFDRGVTHLDFEARNVLVDANFQGYLIDFSMARPHANESDYQLDGWSFLRQHQDPEIENPDLLPGTLVPRDGRRLDLWSFASVLYLLLHKTHPKRWYHYAEWKFNPKMRCRFTDRQMREPVDVRENLSQDCADVLQAALHIYPAERPNVEELCTFPWFNGGHLGSGVDFTNPKMNHYSKRRKRDAQTDWVDPVWVKKVRRKSTSTEYFED